MCPNNSNGSIYYSGNSADQYECLSNCNIPNAIDVETTNNNVTRCYSCNTSS